MILTTLLSNLNEIVIALANIFVIAMSIFMEPPLSIFVGIIIFGILLGIINRIYRSAKVSQMLGYTDKQIVTEYSFISDKFEK